MKRTIIAKVVDISSSNANREPAYRKQSIAFLPKPRACLHVDYPLSAYSIHSLTMRTGVDEFRMNCEVRIYLPLDSVHLTYKVPLSRFTFQGMPRLRAI